MFINDWGYFHTCPQTFWYSTLQEVCFVAPLESRLDFKGVKVMKPEQTGNLSRMGGGQGKRTIGCCGAESPWTESWNGEGYSGKTVELQILSVWFGSWHSSKVNASALTNICGYVNIGAEISK